MAESGGHHSENITEGDPISKGSYSTDERNGKITAACESEWDDLQNQEKTINSLTCDNLFSQYDSEYAKNEREVDNNVSKGPIFARNFQSYTISGYDDKFIGQKFMKYAGEDKDGFMKREFNDNGLDETDAEHELEDGSTVSTVDCDTFTCSSANNDENESNAYQSTLVRCGDNSGNAFFLENKDEMCSLIPTCDIQHANRSLGTFVSLEMVDWGNAHEDEMQDDTESFHSTASSTTKLVDVFASNMFDNAIVDRSPEPLVTEKYGTNFEIQSTCKSDKLVQTTIKAHLDNKEIQTEDFSTPVNNDLRGVDKGVQYDQINCTKQQHICAFCTDVKTVDKGTQCALPADFPSVDHLLCFNNAIPNEKGFSGKVDNDNVGPISVKSDTAIFSGYNTINRSGRHTSKKERLLHLPCTKVEPKSKNAPKIAVNDKRKRGRLRRFEKGDGSGSNCHCYQMTHDSAANLYYEQDGFYELHTRRYNKNTNSGENADVEDKCGKDDRGQYKTFNYLLNNCTPTFALPLINITRSVFASSGNLNTTNSCDPNASDGEDNGASDYKPVEKPYHSRFDNLSANSAGSYLKEYLSGNAGKYGGPCSTTEKRSRTGMFLNTLSKKKYDSGKDGSNNGATSNRFGQLDDKGKVQASQFIGEYLYELWKNECLCDVSIKVGAQSYLAHKIVLAAFSDVFCPSEPMPTPTLMVDVPNSSPNAVFEILQYLYTSEMKITDDSLEDILNAALFLGVTDVVELIKDILAHPTKENVVHYLEVADRMQMPVNINDTPQLFREYLHEIWDSEIFKHITEEEMRKLLSDQMIMVDSETDLITALSKWAEGDLEKRVKLVPKLLKYINFVRIEPDDLAKTTDNYPHIFNNTECQAILAEVYKSFAIIETSTIKGDNGGGFSSNHQITNQDTWRKEEDIMTTSQLRALGRVPPDFPSNTAKAHLTPDTDATRRSITNQFRRASRRMNSLTEENPILPDKRIQFNQKGGYPQSYNKSTLDRKGTAMPLRDQRNPEQQRSLGMHCHGLESTFQADPGIRLDVRDRENCKNQIDLHTFESCHSKPGGGGGYLNKERSGRFEASNCKETRNPFRDHVGNKEVQKLRDGQHLMSRRDMGNCKNEFNKDNTPCRDLYNKDFLRDHKTGSDCPTNMDTDCLFIPPNWKCTRSLCIPNDCPQINCSQLDMCTSKNIAQANRTKSNVRDQARSSIRDTARTSRRAGTRSPIRQNTMSPPTRRSTTPPPKKPDVPTTHRSETPPSCRRRTSPNRDSQRSLQRRGVRLPMRDNQIGSPDNARHGKPFLLEHNFSPTVINEGCHPSLTRKVLQTYKQENPDTYNHVSTPSFNQNGQPATSSQRKSREDMPVVFNK